MALQDILNDINAISKAINTNELVKGARESVEKGLKAFMITPKEKAQIKAQFEMQFTGAILTKIIESAMQMRVNDSQISVHATEIALRTAQKELVDQQTLTEVQNTIKVTNEGELLVSNKAFVVAQTATEGKRKLDAMAGINIKNWQAIGAKENALFEESRRHVLIKSTLFNSQIQKADKSTAWFNSLAVDDGFTMTEAHISSVKADIDNISVEEITYVSGISKNVEDVSYGT